MTARAGATPTQSYADATKAMLRERILDASMPSGDPDATVDALASVLAPILRSVV